ncbi:glycosyltransferase [Nitrococcus mobilis]|uniref:Glycosyl transferase, group 2 family protein n=1 Tax=Nitrococcus mobilis Nb-231 TaxID=314278 RepID=A4BPA1_9GAMM|nr:glycosyltransferase [Nitrococcus mobilis]EAR22402.1 glycosyl transferase, group 2 family protein [Nitrococcus mobilis Nb-231]
MLWTAYSALLGAVLWLSVLAAPWRPWSTQERLDEAWGDVGQGADLRDITVLIPARNEVQVIARCLSALGAQGKDLRVVIVDDQSTDATVAAIPALPALRLEVIAGRPLPEGWAGKLWALEQGLQRVHTPFTLLLDADIVLAPGLVAILRARLLQQGLDLISVMPWLRMQAFWERLLIPAFIFFFKLLYPFRLANSGSARFAAAAGGCILLRTEALHRIGGFAALRGALIDDCTLARRVKVAGGLTWIGLTRSAWSLRSYRRLSELWNMVARSAFTQLRYSTVLLFACTLIMMIGFWGPVVGLALGEGMVRWVGLLGWSALCVSYLPTLLYYRLSPLWALLLPIIAMLYLAMTWTSAVRYWRGIRSRWKGRTYV